jgi:ABC-type Fe3+-hydroxamate transport system substrate-binding protein
VPTVVIYRFTAVAVLALLAVLTAACGERAEPTGDLEQPYPVTVQGAGEQPTVAQARPERIVALDPGAAELVIALGARDRLVGIPAGVRRGDGPRQAPGAAVQVVSRNGQVQVDEIAALEPDLIVATPGMDLIDLARAQRESGAALYVQPSSSVDDVMRATLELGSLVGEPVNARRVAEQIRADVATVEDTIAGLPPRTTFVDTGFFIPVPERSLLGDLVRRAGGRSIAGETPSPEPFPLERLRRSNPQVYLATSDSQVTLEDLRANQATADLRAVRRGRFAIIQSELANRPGPRVGRALEQIAAALYPNAFAEQR